jgi:hypothetical protein
MLGIASAVHVAALAMTGAGQYPRQEAILVTPDGTLWSCED